jgi:hypothetical protein
MAEVPSIGEEIEIAGVKYARIPAFKIAEGQISRSNTYPYVSRALPPTVSGCRFTGKGRSKKPIIESARHEREVAARHGYVKDGACFDDVEDPNK